ncbi:GNAT family N-acetyltransferase [Fredinandcohnia sp. QZ13]|uniref:GNAT family N-acetyltransferase n=1 Tax=Fredinandcohnia sp. QZ13 TaxID=3073144 RepID=UPI002853472F|nr:GNAT family N-acetyltransferase [Fredinandcohnia sp. QZ13]MDR4889752.1 GNAT family N-acetyltransferase [Fredinandcohnia sp. QZ13]
MLVREITPEDAENFVKLTQQVENTSEYMHWEAGERKVSPDQQRKMIERIGSDENSTIFVAEEDNQLIGFLMAIGGNARRNKHSVYIVIGILKDFRGKGVGTKLFKQLEKWALTQQIHRLELTVVTQNKAGLSLYKKMGFEIEGTKRHSLLIGGVFVDEYYMAKIL